MNGAVRARLADGRWHFQHGPIDCIVLVEGEPAAAAACIERAWQRFVGLLDALVGELPLLRTDLSSEAGSLVAPDGPVARRMVAACRPHARGGRFITAMAAVAGSVAEELIACVDDPRIDRAFVNNGGDIALHLGVGKRFDIGLVDDPARGLAGLLAGRFAIDHASAVRGVATSGWRGRSLSRGIADAATVLAASASQADAAATVIGNAVDVDDPRIVRRPADTVRDDSDLGGLLVTCAVPALDAAAVARALDAGAEVARQEIARGRIIASVLSLQGSHRVVGDVASGRRLAAARPPPHRSLVPC